MKVYVSREALNQSINYFKENVYNSPEQIGLFLVFKAASMNNKTYIKFKSFESDEKTKILEYMYNLCSLFNKTNETGLKRTALFPFSIGSAIKNSMYYNGGTVFSGLVSRISDTIDNTLTDDNKFIRKDELSPGYYKFAPNYISILINDFLNGNKISLNKLAAWYFRFFEFNVPDDWDNIDETHIRDFTRICIKRLQDDLNITSDEKSILFEEDDFQITYQNSIITGNILRDLLVYENGSEPDIQFQEYQNLSSNISILSIEQVNDLLVPQGKNITHEQLREMLLSVKQVILAGPPGTGKTFIAEQVKRYFKESFLVQFHPNSSYEQFIGGFIFNENGEIISKAGIFVEFCQRAKLNPNERYIFHIDEINRANVSKVFGEIILTLDREYTTKLSNELLLENGDKISDFSIPNNVYIIATMNSADRSIALVDYAIRRRFAYVNFYPNSEIIDYLSDYTNIDFRVSKLMDRINEKINNVFGDSDLLLGQSYFIPKWALIDGRIHWNNEILLNLFNYYILPIIEEYSYGNKRYLLNILGDNLISRIDDTNEFIKEIKKQFNV